MDSGHQAVGGGGSAVLSLSQFLYTACQVLPKANQAYIIVTIITTHATVMPTLLR